LNVVEQVTSDIDWLPSDDSGDDVDESCTDVDRPLAVAADDDDNDNDSVLSIDVQDSPRVNAGPVQVTATCLPASPSEVCHTHTTHACTHARTHASTHTHKHFTALLDFVLVYPGEPASERQNQEGKTNLDLLEQGGSGIRWAIWKFAR